MEDNELDALKFAVNDKANSASKLMNQYRDNDKSKFDFYYGKYMALNEVYSLLKNGMD